MHSDGANPYAAPVVPAEVQIPQPIQRRWLLGIGALVVVTGFQLFDGMYYSGTAFGILSLLAALQWRPPFIIAAILHGVGVIAHIARAASAPILPHIVGTTLNVVLLLFVIQAIPVLWRIVALKKHASADLSAS